MASYHRVGNHRASSSAFAWGRQVHTKYKSGCLRKILIQSRGYSTAINPMYGEVGAFNEDRHAKRLEAAGQGFIREIAFDRQINDAVTITGHADFALVDAARNVVSVDELKSVTSKNTRRDVIRQGHYVPENLAQLICYMSAFNVTTGRLIYTYYEKIADQWTALEEKIFPIEVDDFGRIHVESKPSQYTVHDLYAHQMLAADVIATGKVGERPLLWDALFVSPCKFCAHSTVCDQWDSGLIESPGAFVKLASQFNEKGTVVDE